jgi:hypothetical protein
MMEEVMEPEDKYAIIRDALFRLGGRVRHDVLEGEVCGRKHRWRAEPVVLTNRSFKIYLKILVLKGHILKSEVETPVGKNLYYELVGKIARRVELHRSAIAAGIMKAGHPLPPILESYRKSGKALLEEFPKLVPEVVDYGSKRFVTWMTTKWKPDATQTLSSILAREYVLIAGEAVIPMKSITKGMREMLNIE